ncbi:host-nuclease inhibitor Gam family protein [Clostridium sp. UBA1056]|uniref:host-nuclease inhibitor Gam family protein n=1 Tax=unclassified Clostridium TaxID=2614128 RepID=UPI003216CC57
MNELRAIDLEEVVNGYETEDQGFKVKDLQGANWCFRKLKALEERKAELNAVAAEEIQRINSWLESTIKSVDSDEEYFKTKILEYYTDAKSENSKFKLTTPYGKVTSRKNKKWCYQDEETIKQYMQDNNDSEAIRIKEELNKTYIKSKYKDGVNQETGELIPGIEVIETEDITVKVE